MISQLNDAIASRVKEVLQFHLNGTPEEFESATSAVMTELSEMGGLLEQQLFTSHLSMDSESDREQLAKHLANSLAETSNE